MVMMIIVTFTIIIMMIMLSMMMISSLSTAIPSSMKSSGVQQLCDQHSSDGQITRLPNIVPASPLYYAPYNGPPAQVQQTIKSIVLTIFYNNIALHCVRFLEQSAQCRLIDWCIGFYGHYGPEGLEWMWISATDEQFIWAAVAKTRNLWVSAKRLIMMMNCDHFLLGIFPPISRLLCKGKS